MEMIWMCIRNYR